MNSSVMSCQGQGGESLSAPRNSIMAPLTQELISFVGSQLGWPVTVVLGSGSVI